MIYSNGDSAALSAMERDRTGNYGEDGFRTQLIRFHCDECGEPIREGDNYYEFDGEKICEDCICRHECVA